MKQSRRQIVNLMRRLDYPHVADLAEQELPDPVEMEQVIEFASRHGITRDDLISRMGGSP